MKKRFENTPMMIVAFTLLFVKLLATVFCFLFNRLLPATFPSVLYIYVFLFSLFSTDFGLALLLLPYTFIASVLPALAAIIGLYINRRGAGFCVFVLMLLCMADILFILVHPLTGDLLFALGGIGLNLLIILSLVMVHHNIPPKFWQRK